MANAARKVDDEPEPLTATELLAIRGTPEFDAEVRRQLTMIAEHDRRTKRSERWEPDWAALEDVWK